MWCNFGRPHSHKLNRGTEAAKMDTGSSSDGTVKMLSAAACGAAAAIACLRAQPPAATASTASSGAPAARNEEATTASASSPVDEFKGKVCLVTGGAMGIGRAIVEEFASRGATVVYADLVRCLEDGADPVAGELQTRAGLASGSFAQAIQWVKCDASQADQVEAAVQEALDRCGRIDILVNNCGICPDDSCKPAHELAVEMYDKVMAVNSRSYFLFAKYVIGKAFLPQGGGVIVNIASVQGLQSVPCVPAYASSKGAVINFTRNLAVEYAGKNIRVNAVNPGSVRTPMLMHFLGDDAEKTDPTPMKRWGKPEEIAAAA